MYSGYFTARSRSDGPNQIPLDSRLCSFMERSDARVLTRRSQRNAELEALHRAEEY